MPSTKFECGNPFSFYLVYTIKCWSRAGMAQILCWRNLYFRLCELLNEMVSFSVSCELLQHCLPGLLVNWYQMHQKCILWYTLCNVTQSHCFIGIYKFCQSVLKHIKLGHQLKPFNILMRNKRIMNQSWIWILLQIVNLRKEKYLFLCCLETNRE